MRLAGREPDNYTADQRAIVVHGAWYADPSLIATQGKLGRSEGCFVFGEELLPMILYKLGPGRLLFADRLSAPPPMPARSEEHTSELQSLMRISYAVFCLKKKKK